MNGAIMIDFLLLFVVAIFAFFLFWRWWIARAKRMQILKTYDGILRVSIGKDVYCDKDI